MVFDYLAYRQVNRQRERDRAARWFVKNKSNPIVQAKLKENSLRFRLNKRLRILSMYGWRCGDCGMDDGRVLQVDHVRNDGGKERREQGTKIVGKIIRGELPKKDYQLLCANCNWIKRLKQAPGWQHYESINQHKNKPFQKPKR